MATVIRLARYGSKKRPYYHIVVTDSRNARNSGNTLETVGKYDPMQPKDSEKPVILKIDEIKAWLSKGAKPSDRVYKFLANADILPKKEYPVQTKKHLQSEKTLMKIKDKAEKRAKIEEEKAAAAEAEKPAEAPAEETAPAVETEKAEVAPKESAPVAEAEKTAEAPVEEVKVEAPAEETAPAAETEKSEEVPAEKTEAAKADEKAAE